MKRSRRLLLPARSPVRTNEEIIQEMMHKSEQRMDQFHLNLKKGQKK